MKRLRSSCQPMDVRGGVAFPGGSRNRIEFEPEPPTAVERLLAALLARAMRTFPESHFKRPLKRAAREALRLTDPTGYASLLLPELFAELAIAELLAAEYHRMGRI
jgi:hypothetical protein